jgi:hypothetical protein
VRYSAPFFRRRWTVPLAAAAVYPLFGDRSLEIVSLTGYIVAAAALYLLARQRFTPAVSAGAAVLASLLPQYRATALSPLTDTWGIALEALCLVLAIRFCDTGRRPLVVGWLFAMLLLAFTRDDAAVVALALLIAGVWSRRALLLGAVGSAAAVVPSLWFGTHYPRLLAYTLADSHIPPATGLTWSLHHYWGGVETLARGLATPIRFGIPPVTGLALLVGLAGLLLAPRGLFRRLAATTAVAAVVFMLSLPQSGYRIALVLLPSATAGYAALGAAGVRWRREDRGVRVQ